MKPTLLILAAGMGSRYGGLKQIDPIGPNNEVLMDYSIYDAVTSGFDKIVFVIRKDFKKQFIENIGNKYNSVIKIEYAFQDLNDLPQGFNLPANRKKPWGTAHAVYAARNVIDAPFAMINADDFYGQNAFKTITEQLKQTEIDSKQWCLVAYNLQNVLSESGAVNRAICEHENNYLTSIVERLNIIKQQDHAVCENGNLKLSLNSPASVNLFGFTPKIFSLLENNLKEFLNKNIHNLNSEFFIPTQVNEYVSANQAKVKVLNTNSNWFGITYPEDKQIVQQKILELVENKQYPTPLF